MSMSITPACAWASHLHVHGHHTCMCMGITPACACPSYLQICFISLHQFAHSYFPSVRRPSPIPHSLHHPRLITHCPPRSPITRLTASYISLARQLEFLSVYRGKQHVSLSGVTAHKFNKVRKVFGRLRRDLLKDASLSAVLGINALQHAGKKAVAKPHVGPGGQSVRDTCTHSPLEPPTAVPRPVLRLVPSRPLWFPRPL